MRTINDAPGRRSFLQAAAFTAASCATASALADALTATPALTEGPFYPDKLPLDTDNDLIVINDTAAAALGEITHLTGRILDAMGAPIRNAFVEIWQVDNKGVYLHSADDRIRDQRDVNFQGYGRFLTDSQGRYYFRTIKPVPYPGRTPHIHYAISRNGKRICTTQLFIAGEEQNERDGVFRGIRDSAAQKSVLAEFKPLKDSKIGELEATFDVVLGKTFQEADEGPIKGGIARPEGFGPGGGGPGGGPRGGRGGPRGPGERGPNDRGPGGPPPRGPRPEPRP